MKKLLALIILNFAVTLFFYNSMPGEIASHWDINGNVNGYMPRYGIFFVPVLIIGLVALFMFIPKMDPLKKNILSFMKYYDSFILVLILFMSFIQAHLILWNIGYPVPVEKVVPVAVAVLLFYAGILCEHSKRNWFIGIRTPWTLSSDEVWNKTNKLGGKIFKGMGVLMLAGLLAPKYFLYIIIIPTISASFFLLGYSYFLFRKKK